MEYCMQARLYYALKSVACYHLPVAAGLANPPRKGSCDLPYFYANDNVSGHNPVYTRSRPDTTTIVQRCF